MQRSLFSAVSGLKNHQTWMDVIGNNIANVNTTAFKAGRATFKESFSQVLTGATRPAAGQGGINPLEVGSGMQLASIDTIFTQGNLETTGGQTDMMVQGNSFFVVAQGSNQSFYTRAGNFKPDADGRLVSPTNGFVLQGRMATNGVLGGALTDIKLPAGQTAPARATTRASLSGNLNSAAPSIVAVDTANPTAAELADPANSASVTQTSKSVYDSLGVSHDITITAWKVAPNKWDFKADLSSVNGGGTPSTFGPGSLTFKSDGTLDIAASTLPTIKFTPAGNAAPVSIKLDPGTPGNGITSFATGNSALIRDQDGYTAGTLTNITIGRDGTIIGAFSNGTNQALAQVAMADFNNPEGLERAGDNMYTMSANSGSPVVGYSGRETSSTIASGALEMSNVDLAQEFTDMIIAQRGFQANGKMITTSDDMLQELVSLKR